MLALVVALALCVALGAAVVVVVALPARREGRELLAPRGEEVVGKVIDAASTTKDRTTELLGRRHG